HNHVVAMAEEHVTRCDHNATIFDGGKIDLPAPTQPLPVWNHFAVDAQSRHPAVRENTKTQVRCSRSSLNRKDVRRIAFQTSVGQHFVPGSFRATRECEPSVI